MLDADVDVHASKDNGGDGKEQASHRGCSTMNISKFVHYFRCIGLQTLYHRGFDLKVNSENIKIS
jgi:hypothetical protein